LSTICIKFLLC